MIDIFHCILLIYLESLCMWEVHACHSVRVEVSEQFAGIHSLLPTVCIQGIQFRPLGLVEGAPIDGAILLGPNPRILPALLKIQLCLLMVARLKVTETQSPVVFYG